MKYAVRYELIINGRHEGPYTAQETSDRVRECFDGDWHWEPHADGSQRAVRPDGPTIAEAVVVEI